jgi:two-component system cell cycle sensor histidine kinase PleC
MTALAPMREDSPPLQPETLTGEKSRPRYKPIMNAGTGL